MTSRVWSIGIDGETFVEYQIGSRQFRCVFDIEISPGDALSLADIRLYNMAETTTVNQRSSISLRAGNDFGDDIIFTGFVTNVLREKNPGKADIVLRLICKSGQPTNDRGSIQKSFGVNTNVVDVIRALAQSWPIPLDIDPTQFADAPLLSSGYIADGDIPKCLDDLAYSFGFSWVQELGRLVVTKEGFNRTSYMREVNQFTGMVGIPEVTRGPNGIGVFVAVSLDPFLRINDRINISSKYATFNTGNLYIQELTGDANANGEYNIFSLHHRGDSGSDGYWVTEIDGIRPGAISEPVTASVENGDLIWGAKVSQEFRVRVREVAAELNMDPNWLMAVMGFETGYTFDPSIRNPGSSATGLIQFLDSTARALNTTVAQLAGMTAVEQLTYVGRYYQIYASKIKNLGDAYMAVLWPAAIGRPDSQVLWEKNSGPYQEEYKRNSGLDVNNDGMITRGEASASVNSSYMRGRNYAR